MARSPFDNEFSALRAKIFSYADSYGIDRKIALWQLWRESDHFAPDVIAGRRLSSAGAGGIAQFMPATARRFGVNVRDVDSSLNGWGKYMRWLLDRFNQNYRLALAGYNAGEGNVDKYKGIPPFEETQNYIAFILGNAGSLPQSVKSANSSLIYIFGFLLVFLILDD